MVTAALGQDRPPWVHRGFLKDKIRVQERYWRPLEKRKRQQDTTTVIPDGILWRKYLKLLSALIEGSSFQWILLESAAELMDWRSSSPSIQTENGEYVSESSALQERNKIRNLLTDFPENVWPLCDLSIREEECDEWDLLDYLGMSVTDRSHHALLRAGRWLGSSSQVILLSNDDSFDGEMRVLNMDEFLMLFGERYPDSDMDHLLTLKQSCDENYQQRNFPPKETDNEKMTEEQVEEGLNSGTLLRGRLEVTKANPKEAYVTVGNVHYFVNLDGSDVPPALHHDVVIVQSLPESQWGRPVGRRRLVHYRTDEEAGNIPDEEGLTVPSASIVSVSSTSRRAFVATLVDEPVGDERAVLVVPMDIRIPKIRIQSRGWPAYVNQRLLIEVDGWERTSNYPSGHCIKVLGPVGDLETEVSCVLHEHEIQLEPFSMKAIAALPPAGAEWTIPGYEIERRRDLRRTHRIFSVDPPGCQDIDDTMHARVLPNGDIEVGVHIADVTYFVPHGSSLDKEAQRKGTTFYLVDRRFDMLPSLLSSDLCSLHGNTDRLAVSVIWTLSSDLEVVKSCWYGRTVIHNCQAMTYEQAHNILQDKPPDDPSKPLPPPLTAGAPVDPSQIGSLKAELSILQRLARKLRKDREEIGGAVDLSSGDLGTELKFALDDNGNPVKVSPKKELEIHHTIAEVMILANQYVANKIYGTFPDSSLLRIHPAVAEDRFEDLENALKAGGISFDGSSNMALAESLKKAKQEGKGDKVVNSLWQSLATRAMSEALYICTGLQEKGVGLSHYGLGIDKYTHFTSPIRRYADVVVHKQLLAALAGEDIKLAIPEPSGDRAQQSRLVLDALPDSSAISILKGEGLPEKKESGGQAMAELEDDDFLDSLIDGASELALGTTGNEGDNDASSSPDSMKQCQGTEEMVPYSTSQVGKICEGLNQRNRMAKLSSMECQRLFLSLYFNDHVEIAQAVVTDLRVNGLIVYVPEFDLKGPLFLSDMDGDVQIDPALFGLSPDAGLPPTVGFALAPNCRRFSAGRCFLKDSQDGGSLEVVIPESPKKCIFRPLDVITVQLSCNLADVRARIPPPRFHLISTGKQTGSRPKAAEPRSVTSAMIRHGEKEPSGLQQNLSDLASKNSCHQSFYEKLSSLVVKPVLTDVRLRLQQHKVRVSETDSSMPGRKTFGGFQNPDTRSATQEAAIAETSTALAQRRATALASQSRHNEYDTTRSIEREVTARMQRLAAEKRGTRRSKAK